MSKPREWWFNLTWYGEYSSALEDGPKYVNDEHVHVVEHSALVEAENAVIRAAGKLLTYECTISRLEDELKRLKEKNNNE